MVERMVGPDQRMARERLNNGRQGKYDTLTYLPCQHERQRNPTVKSLASSYPAATVTNM
jgi:hypothetical protein